MLWNICEGRLFPFSLTLLLEMAKYHFFLFDTKASVDIDTHQIYFYLQTTILTEALMAHGSVT